MEQLLITRLHSYIIQNNPDLLLSLEGESRISNYLEQKVATVGPLIDRLIEEEAAPYFIEEECMEILTHDLRPSRYHYLSSLLAAEYKATYEQFVKAGILVYEIANLIALTIDLFEQYRFSDERENNPDLEAAVREELKKYLSDPIYL